MKTEDKIKLFTQSYLSEKLNVAASFCLELHIDQGGSWAKAGDFVRCSFAHPGIEWVDDGCAFPKAGEVFKVIASIRSGEGCDDIYRALEVHSMHPDAIAAMRNNPEEAPPLVILEDSQGKTGLFGFPAYPGYNFIKANEGDHYIPQNNNLSEGQTLRFTEVTHGLMPLTKGASYPILAVHPSCGCGNECCPGNSVMTYAIENDFGEQFAITAPFSPFGVCQVVNH